MSAFASLQSLSALGEDSIHQFKVDVRTIEKSRTGNSRIRNPILVSYVAKGLLASPLVFSFKK